MTNSNTDPMADNKRPDEDKSKSGATSNSIPPMAEDKFTDQFFASTEGRNDIRRQQIEAYTTNKIIEELETVQRQYMSLADPEESNSEVLHRVENHIDDRIAELKEALNHREKEG